MANILVVDDDPMVLEIIMNSLSEAGHSPQGAESGTEALDLARKTRYDLIVLDRNLGDMTGLQVLAALRREPAAKSVKVIMCTGADMVGDVADAFAAGAADYVVKPLDFPRLLEKVSKHTSRP